MSTPLTSEESERYSSIIDAILATANLETITRKKIIKGLETSLRGKDLSDQKHAIKKLIEARFDAVSGVDTPVDGDVDGGVDAVSVPTPDSTTVKRAASDGMSDTGDLDNSESPEPARKKVKRSSSEEDADAKLAAQLQAQENRLARSRTTRGGGDKAKPRKTKSAPRKKSSKKVKAEDDSDVESGTATPKRKSGGGFQKPFNLSEALAEVCGEPQLSRPQVVKKLWEHIKANELQDPSDRRQIICDAKMQAVFKQPRVDMFKMNKDIGSHLYPVGEE